MHFSEFLIKKGHFWISFFFHEQVLKPAAVEDRSTQDSVPPQLPTAAQQQNLINNLQKFHTSGGSYPINFTPADLLVTGAKSSENFTSGKFCQIPLAPPPPVPPSSKMADLNLNKTTIITDPLPLSLKLSASSPPPSSPDQKSSSAARHPSAFQAMPNSFDSNSGDSIISVAWWCHNIIRYKKLKFIIKCYLYCKVEFKI